MRSFQNCGRKKGNLLVFNSKGAISGDTRSGSLPLFYGTLGMVARATIAHQIVIPLATSFFFSSPITMPCSSSDNLRRWLLGQS